VHTPRSSANAMNHTCLCTFAFPAEAGPHLPTPEGWRHWRAELAWVAG